MSVSFSGEIGLRNPRPERSALRGLSGAARRQAQAHGLRLFGAQAVDSMRLEKGYRHWKADLVTEFNPVRDPV